MRRHRNPFSILLVLVGWLLSAAGCAHVAVAPGDGARVEGQVELRVLEALDYAVPAGLRKQGLRVTLFLEAEEDRASDSFSTFTDRDGRFHLDRLPPGRYKLWMIQAPGVTPKAQAYESEMRFELWEKSFLKGPEGIRLAGKGPVWLQNARFTLTPGQSHPLPAMRLEFRQSPFTPSSDCLVKTVFLGGIGGSVYLSSTPVFARLCVLAAESVENVSRFNP